VEQRYLANVFGVFRAAVEEYLPLTVINDWNLTGEDLSRYKVLILANTACLDDRQAVAVREFVANGGGLVASLDTSLFDEFGNPRNNFALAELFGVDYRGPVSTAANPSEEIDVNFATSIGLNGPAVRVRPRAADQAIPGAIRIKSDPSASEFPAVITSKFGQGRVAYFAAGLDAGYYLYAYPYQRLVLKHAIEWAAREKPPVWVTAPMCVHSTVMRQRTDAGSRLVVHLFNDLNTTAHHALPQDDIPLREETVPIHNIKVASDARLAIVRETQEPDGKELPLERTEDGVSVEVPRLDIHTLVLAELKP
jgi:hypothetical protein